MSNTKNWVVFSFIFLLLLNGFSSASASPPARFVGEVALNVVSTLVRWLWSLKSSTKTGVSGVSSRSMMKFEDGYSVETVFDGSKPGIEPYSVEVSPNGELLVLDAENSNIYKISTPLSRYGRPKLMMGSSSGYSGHVDGRLKEARMNHPKGVAVDDRGNTYIADTMNKAIRKISNGGEMTTIAGGYRGRGGEDAKFSDDFDVTYSKSRCSLLVVDRENRVIREIELHNEDCNYQSYDVSFHLGIAMLAAAALFGYLIASLQHKIEALFSLHDDSRTKATPMAPYRRPPRSVRPPLIPDEDEELEKPEQGFFGSIGSVMGVIFRGLFSGSTKKKPLDYSFHQEYQQQFRQSNGWPVQESFVIPNKNEPPSIEPRTATTNQNYPFMNKELGNHQHFRHSYGDYYLEKQKQMQTQMKVQQQQQKRQKQEHHQSYHTANPKTCYEKRSEANQIVFGAVQEQDGRREAVVIKAVDYGDPRSKNRDIRPRLNYVGYPNGY